MAAPLRVLIVEDQEDDAALIFRELRRAGGWVLETARVETEADMRAALETRTWDVVISDYTLPNFDGPSALALLRRMGLDLPFIIVTGTVGEEVAVAAMK